ncbi:MAG: YtxH domain-containing protein [Frankiaceae bacterium]
MRYKLTFAVGFAAGYVLGARAGTERYEQLENAWRRFVDTPAVQQAAGVIGAQAGQVIGQAKHVVGEKVSTTVGGRLHGARSQNGTGSPTSSRYGTAADDAASPYPAPDFGGHA